MVVVVVGGRALGAWVRRQCVWGGGGEGSHRASELEASSSSKQLRPKEEQNPGVSH